MWSALKGAVVTPRSRALLLAGVMFIMVGLSNIVTANEIHPHLPSYQAYVAQFSMFDGLVWWGSFFMVAGIIAIIASCWDKYLYVGFFSLMLMAMWWAGLFAASLLMTGYTRIIPSIFTWGLISLFLYTVSAWKEEEPNGQE